MKMIWIGRIISWVVALLFIMSSVMKLLMPPQVIEGMGHLGLPVTLIVTIAILEMLCVVVYLIPQTAIIGAILFTGYVGGIIVTHLRVGEAVSKPVMFGILVWLGLYLREPRLRALIPLIYKQPKFG